jgi:hypothetical protein
LSSSQTEYSSLRSRHRKTCSTTWVERDLDVPQSFIQRIEQRRPESKWNGLLIGLAAGAGPGYLLAKAGCENDSDCSFHTTAAYVPLLAGIGAGAGTLIDFAIKRYDGVYTRTTAFQIEVRLPIP